MSYVDSVTYVASITMGMMEGHIHNQIFVEHLIQRFCDQIGLGVEVQFGKCIYTGGIEPSVKITLINYLKHPAEIFHTAERLGMQLADELRQKRFTIVATDKTRMYEID